MKKNKNIFDVFKNADSSDIEKLSEYFTVNDSSADRVFQKSMRKYSMMTQTADGTDSRRSITCITNITEKKKTGRAVKLALSGAALVCTAAVAVALIKPALQYDAPSVTNRGHAMQQKTVNGRELWTAVPPDQASKEDIFWLMMNSIFYYDKVSGKAEYSYPTGEENIIAHTFADFQYCLSEDRSYVKIQKRTDDLKKALDSNHRSMYGIEEKELYENYSEGNKVIKKDLNTNEISSSVDDLHKSIFDIEPVPDSQRLKYADEEKNIISPDTYYPDPTPEMEHNLSFFQQRLAATGMLDMDKWYTDSIIIVNGRECYHILLSVTDNDAENDIELKNAEIWVDVKTGVVMKLQATDSNDNILFKLEMTKIHYDDEAEPVTPMPEDIKAVFDKIIYSDDERNQEKEEIKEYTDTDNIEELRKRINAMEEQLNELDSKIVKLKDPNNAVLSVEEKQHSLANLEEKRNTVQLALEELEARLHEELEKKNSELDENYNEQH